MWHKKLKERIIRKQISQIILSTIVNKLKSEVMNADIPKIENSFEQLETYPNVTERYYKCIYYKGDKDFANDHCILLHSNKICLITLAPSHPIIKHKKRIAKLDFQVSDKLDRLENKVSGKGKKGAQHIRPDSVLCYVECEDGSKYSIYGCIQGKLIEINDALLENYNLLLEKPLTGGHVAIILPSKKDFDYKKLSLVFSEISDN